MISNPYRARLKQAKRIRFGEPSWRTALRYRLQCLFHRHYYDAYRRCY